MALTQTLVNFLFEYNPETGIVTSKQNTGSRCRIGDVVGWDNGNGGYLRTRIKRKAYYLHRIIWLMVYGELPLEIDHEDHNPANNKLQNLVNVTHSQNLKNQRLHCNNTSGRAGVSYVKNRDMWRAYIEGEYLGQFKTPQEAISAREKAEIERNYHVNHGSIVGSI